MKTIIAVIALIVLLFMLGQIKTKQNNETPDGYTVISCKKVDQIGDTIITLNKLIKIKE